MLARSTSVPGRQNETLRKVRAVAAFREAALDNSVIVPTRGRSLTPNAQYRYPARFSPRFAAAAIQLVTEPGGLVIDPFMGSGTTVIEAMRHGRRAVGMDISPISHFLARTTSAAYSDSDLEAVRSWFIGQVSDFRGLKRAPALLEACPRTNLDMRRNWRLVAVIDGIVAQAVQLSSGQQDLARLAVLRSSQWACTCQPYAPHSKPTSHAMSDPPRTLRRSTQHDDQQAAAEVPRNSGQPPLQCHTQVTRVIHVTCVADVAGASVSGSESGS